MVKEQKVVTVALIQRIFPNYRESIYRSLGDKLNTRIFHGQDRSGIPQMANNYSEKCQLLDFVGLSHLFLTFRLLRYNPSIFIHEFSLSLLNLYVIYIISRLAGRKFILWGHGYDRSKGFHPESRLSDKIRQYLIKRSDSVILYSDAVAQDFSQRYPAQRFFVARNSIDSFEKRLIYSQLTKKGREQIKAELGFAPILNLCFVSRLTPSKKAHLLSEIVEQFLNRGVNVLIHIIGDGESLPALKKIVSSREQTNNFKFYGSIYDEEIASRIIYASDFMIIPAWLGLSINHSFCYGTPVATLLNERHPPEIEFAKDSVNAILANSINELVESVCETWSNSKLYNSMRLSTRLYYESELSLNSMLSGFSEAINYAYSKVTSANPIGRENTH